MGSNGVLVSGNGCSSISSDFTAKRKWCGSTDDEVWKNTSNFDKLSADFCDNQQNMLSFSSPKFDAFSPKENGELLSKNLLQIPTFQNFQHSNSYYSKNAGYSSCNNGSMNATSMYFMNGVKGAFTASQWFELEQQALIYKYILANEPIPPNLLIPIRRAFELAGFSGFPAGLYRPNLFGWGPFHLGLASSTDPEVGRCRRTDGKKWRCSRDAVPDQKYCERHINRGRHRSRKPVEGHTGHSISGGTTNKSSNSNTTTNNVVNMTSSSSALVVPGGGPANSFAINLSQSKGLQSQPATSNHLPSSLVHRSMVDKTNSRQRMQNTGPDFLSPRISDDSKATENTFSIAESAAADFPFLTSDANISSTAQGCSYASRTYGQSQQSPHTLMEDDLSSNFWPKLETQTNTTKLSISIPPADFMSSTSSPTEERKALSPLRLSREFEPAKVHIGPSLGSNTVSNEPSPISWETSLGGPLGEVLKTTTSNCLGNQSKNISAISLLSSASEGSPQLASSPTGVLQRPAFSYFSNSSAGSSPRTENARALESGTLSGDLIGFTLGSSSSLSRCN